MNKKNERNLAEVRAYVRKVLAEVLLVEGVHDPGILKAVFLAGGPGSGKSYTAKSLFGADVKSAYNMSASLGLKFVNSDPAFEHLLRQAGIDPKSLGSMSDEEFKALTEPYDSPRQQAKRTRDAQYASYTRSEGRLGVVIDGTGDEYEKVAAKKQALEKLGYDTMMIFVDTALPIAMERNKHRDRVLKDDLVVQIWTDVQENKEAYEALFGEDFMLVNNDVYGPLPPEALKLANRFMRSPIKNPIGQEWIKQQLGPKGNLPRAYKNIGL